MRNPQIAQRLRQLYELIDRTGGATQDINLQRHWGRYLCVIVAGFLEYSLQTIYSDFADRTASPHTARFVSDRLSRVSNPNSERFIQTASAFNQRWGEELREFFDVDPERTKGAINSIMTERNKIAHGETSQISVARVREYLDRSVIVLEFIENQCMGNA